MTIQDFLLTRQDAAIEDAGDAGLRPVAPANARSGLRSRLNAQELLTMLVSLRSRIRGGDAPRARIRMSVYLPDGRPAVDVRLGPDAG